jgi:hypothetical protein
MKRKSLFVAAIIAGVLMVAGCSLVADAIADPIVGSWQQVSVDGSAALLVTTLAFTKDTFTVTTAGITGTTGTWTKSGSSYTLTGAFFGTLATSSVIVPTFSNSNNTMTYTDANGKVEVYKK